MMMRLPQNVNQIFTYRDYLIVQHASHNDLFPFPCYQLFSLKNEKEIYLPLIGNGIGWRFMEVHETGILFKTPIPNQMKENVQCFFNPVLGNFLSCLYNDIFDSISNKKNVTIAEVTDVNGIKYCFYFNITGLLVFYSMQKPDEKEFHLYDENDKEILFQNDSLDFYRMNVVEDCETGYVSGFFLEARKAKIPFFLPFKQ